MQSELKPCPFCGSDKHMVLSPTCDRSTPYDPADRAFPIVRCGGCFTDVPGKDFDASSKSAVEAWNRRAALSDQERSVEDCAECHGTGEVFGHADDCHDDLCALNGDMHSCVGKVERCGCTASALVDVPAEPVAHLRPCGLTYLSGEKRDGLVVANRKHPKAFPVYASPPLSRQGEDSAEVTRRFSLEWIAGARPPVHPNPMRGRQSFRSIDEAIAFMGRQAEDAQFVSMTEYEEREFDRSEEARTALAATRSGSATDASGTSPIRQRGESDGR